MAITLKDIRDKVDGNEMDLSLMSISKVPVKEIASVTKIRKLDLSCNQIVALPDNFSQFLNYIVKLDLSKNLLNELPNDIFKITSLQHLDLYQNRLQELPVTFCRLKTLKWLDLKDNPLKADVQKVVGDCLNEQQCKKCAISVVNYYQTISSNMERKKQETLKHEREKQAQLKEEKEREARKIKEKKKMEKEERKLKWENMKRERELESKKRKRADDSDEEDSAAEEGESDDSGKSSWFMSFWGVVLTALVAVIACGVGTYVYCRENRSNEECMFVDDWLRNYRRMTSEHLYGFMQVVVEYTDHAKIRFSEIVDRYRS